MCVSVVVVGVALHDVTDVTHSLCCVLTCLLSFFRCVQAALTTSGPIAAHQQWRLGVADCRLRHGERERDRQADESKEGLIRRWCVGSVGTFVTYTHTAKQTQRRERKGDAFTRRTQRAVNAMHTAVRSVYCHTEGRTDEACIVTP